MSICNCNGLAYLTHLANQICFEPLIVDIEDHFTDPRRGGSVSFAGWPVKHLLI